MREASKVRSAECGMRNADRQTTQYSADIDRTVKLGCLPYLNVKPLVYRFEHGELPEGWDLVYATPSTLAKMLASERIDAAPVSSFACLANRDLGIVPGICIASEGEVTSVLMLSKCEPQKVRSVAADTSSLSGRALLRIVLSENYGVHPEFVDCEPVIEKMLAEHDGALIIGNPAMLADKTGLHVLDLGDEWMKLTGLPAVFAVWAGPKQSITPELVDQLTAAKEDGLQRIVEISKEQSLRLGLPQKLCEDYLARVMKYDLGPQQIESLRTFGQKARKHGLIDHEAVLNFPTLPPKGANLG